MLLDRPRFEATPQPTWNEWRDKEADSGARLLSEDTWAIPATAPLLSSQKESQDNLAPILRDWVRVKAHHHLYIEVRERYSNKVLYGPLKVFVHDLAQYMFDTDTVWAFVEGKRAEAQKSFDAENAAYVKALENAVAEGATPYRDWVLGDYAILPDGSLLVFAPSDELTDAYDEADNFYVAFSVEPFEDDDDDDEDDFDISIITGGAQ